MTASPLPEVYFNLVDEPWIRVLDSAGTEREVSLREVFHQALKIRRITGELPTQSFAMVRLLLAVVHRALADADTGVSGPIDADDWVETREDPAGLVADIDAYLDTWHDRFWMHHPVHPFMQVPDLATESGATSGLAKIICDGPGSGTFLTTRLGLSLESITWAEAARWLIHVHAYDLAGIHTGVLGDPRVKGGKGYSIGTGWTGQLGGILAVGTTLSETLLLNLVCADEVTDLRGGSRDVPDCPVWERPPLTSAPEGWAADVTAKGLPYREPTGPVDCYTWQSRRIRLFGDTERVRACINAQGDSLLPQNRFTVEPMSRWRYSDPQTKQHRRVTYMPLTLSPERAMWRGLDSLLAHTDTSGPKSEPAAYRAPAIVDWLSRLSLRGLHENDVVDFESIGVVYESNQSVYGDVLHDSVELPTALLSPTGEHLRTAALEAVEAAEHAVRALADFARNLAKAAGDDSGSNGPQNRASAAGFAALDTDFRHWVLTLRPGVDIDARIASWHTTVRATVLGLADDLSTSAGPAALTGRTVALGPRQRFVDSGIAELWFRRALHKAVPHADAYRVDEPAPRTEDNTNGKVTS